jgi:hypothetical protein
MFQDQSMFVLALGKQPRLNPVLFTFGIVPHVGIAQRRQFTGGVLGSVSSRTGAINHDVRSFVRQKCRSKLRHLVGRQIDRTGQMRVMVGGLRQCFYKEEAIMAIDL